MSVITREAAKKIFDRIDTDRNGQLDENELKQAVQQLKLPKNVHTAPIFSQKTVEFEEFYRFVEKRDRELSNVFAKLDQDKRSQLT